MFSSPVIPIILLVLITVFLLRKPLGEALEALFKLAGEEVMDEIIEEIEEDLRD